MLARRHILFVLVFVPGLVFGQAYKNAQLPVEARVQDLIKRMTIAEKVAQLRTTHATKPRLSAAFFSSVKSVDSVYGNGIGMVNPAFDETAQQTVSSRQQLQSYLLTKTRLGIPAIFLDEAHHGLVQSGVDVFPHAIGFAASWDSALFRKVYDLIARQAAARGTHVVLAPVVDVVRDARWGRTGECFGEDPFLNGVLGAAVVEGLQGGVTGWPAKEHVGATLKHFTGHGQPEAGVNTGPANYSLRSLREIHMKPFEYIIAKAKPACIMSSYCEVDEVPSHANRWLLTDVLKKEWGYRGIVVSDWYGIDQLRDKHHIARDLSEAALKAFKAGVDIDLPNGNNYTNLIQLVKEGKIAVAEIDLAVTKILRLKFQMGLFDGAGYETKGVAAPAGLNGSALALQAAEESMILLKNDQGTLPIHKGQYKTIAVVGPFGATNLLGDYSGVPRENVSILEGIKRKAGNATNVIYAQGCRFTVNGDSISQNNYQFTDRAKLPTSEENHQLTEAAVAVARSADFIVVAVGENELFSREAWKDHPGDISDLNLQNGQEELVKQIAALGKPYVVYLMHGRPLAVNWIAEHAPAIIDGWYMGEQAGVAFANILFGDINPSGKLTMTIPRSVGQVPIFYNSHPSAHFYEYVTESNKPLFPFGFGLSYTSFSYGKPIAEYAAKEKKWTVSINVTNTGMRQGDEIVQMYLHQQSGNSVVVADKELKGFRRISLGKGQTQKVRFEITEDMLRHYDVNMRYVAEPGAYEVLVGTSSVVLQGVVLNWK